ncbi:MAG: G5 domain-containing protein [Anaerolineae bacterium]|nr:G5 domain-containing protein [Anaerolineae bacterium]
MKQNYGLFHPQRRHFIRVIFISILLLLAAACESRDERPSMIVTLVVDGQQRAVAEDLPLTVGEILSQEEVILGPLDEVNPPAFSQIADGMRITVARVTEESTCEEMEVPYPSRTIPNEALAPGETRLAQPGRSGTEQVCYRITIRDGVRGNPVPISRVPMSEPQEEIIYVGPSGELDPVSITGTLAYISSGNVWAMRNASTSKRALTNTNDVDGRVLGLSEGGRSLIFTRQSDRADTNIFNQLWLLPDTTLTIDPVPLMPENVLSADWVPGLENTISYSTGEVTDVAPGWRANNDLFLMSIDLQTGTPQQVQPLVPASSFGLYNWWGTNFEWSPDGTELAWVRADSMGLVDLNTGEFQTLLSYPVFETRQSWSWRASVSFSPDQSLILTTVHGAPIGNEPPQTSPAFHVAVTATSGIFNANVAENTGIWSTPQFSPPVINPQTGQQTGRMAYLRARDLSNSINQGAEYDLVVADRDGSNARVIFPAAGQPALNSNASITWSPDGTQVAFIYQGNLWLVDVASSTSHQLTLDGNASQPIWTR